MGPRSDERGNLDAATLGEKAIASFNGAALG